MLVSYAIARVFVLDLNSALCGSKWKVRPLVANVKSAIALTTGLAGFRFWADVRRLLPRNGSLRKGGILQSKLFGVDKVDQLGPGHNETPSFAFQEAHACELAELCRDRFPARPDQVG